MTARWNCNCGGLDGGAPRHMQGDPLCRVPITRDDRTCKWCGAVDDKKHTKGCPNAVMAKVRAAKSKEHAVKKPTKKTKPAETCKAVASSGALKCQLEAEHTGEHSTAARKTKPKQHATWIANPDGKVKVTAYQRGKRMSDWTEAAAVVLAPAKVEPAVETKKAKAAEGERPWPRRLAADRAREPECTCTPSAQGRHSSKCERLQWAKAQVARLQRDMGTTGVLASELLAARDRVKILSGKGAEVAKRNAEVDEILDEDDAAARWACETSFTGDDGREHKCEARNEHNGPHYVFCKVLGRTVHAASARPRPLTLDDEPEDPEADTVALAAMADDPITFDEHMDRKYDEQRVRDAEDEREPRHTDLCIKCGRELGEHDGKKCPPERCTSTNTAVWHAPAMCRLDKGHKGDHEAEVTVADGWPETGQVRGIAWDKQGRGKGNDIISRPAGGAAITSADLPAPQKIRDRAPTATSSPGTSLPPVGETITCRGRVYPIHPAARLFETSQAQFNEVVESIRTHGQQHKVQLLDEPGNPVIDGCNRLRACELLGIDPLVEIIHVENPIRHVIAMNLARRHLDESQRAMAATELATMEHGANQHTRTGKSAAPQVTQAEAASLMGVSERLVRDAAKVKREGVPEVTKAIRDGKLKVSAGAELAKLGPKQQREILDKVAKGSGEVKSGKIRALVKQEEKRAIVRKINTGRVAALPASEFGVILADYPWLYDNSDQHEGSRGHMGYPAMSMDEILAHAREVAKRAAKDCIVALWTTNLYSPRMQAVIDAYGAEHRTVYTWPKPRAGVGTWGRGQTEHLMIASIGAPVHTLNEVSTLLPAWKPAQPGEHSSKPAEVAELLAKHCGGPFLELFGREQREGWTVWGAETDKFSSEAA